MKFLKHILFLFLLLAFGNVSSQKVDSVTSIEETLSEFSDHSFFNSLPEGRKKKFSNSEIVQVNIDLRNVDLEEEFYGVFVSDAEVQVLYVNGTKFYSGKYQDVNKLTRKWDSRHFTVPSTLLSEGSFTVEVTNITKSSFVVSPAIFPASFLEKDLLEVISESKTGIIFTIVFLGGILVFLIYIIGLYIQTGNKDFKFYGYYLGAILLHNLIQSDAFLKIFVLFPSHPIYYHFLNEFLQMFIYSFFMLFLKVFLELKNGLPKIDRLLNFTIVMTIVFGFIFLFSATLIKDFIFLQNYLSILWLVVAGVGTVIVVQVFRQSRNPIRYFIMSGGIFLLVGSVLELYSSLSLEGAYNWNLYAVPRSSWYPFNFTQLAILLETVCFALGIGYKIRQKEKLLITFQQKEIQDLQNATLKKDSEIQDLAVSIASEKSLRAETSHLLELLETQYGLVQYQLNPHFLFNNLTAINNLVMHDEQKKASKYLVEFSHLLRQTINRSKSFTSRLEDERVFMKKYLNLEKQRLKERFDFEIVGNASVFSSDIEVPSFIIQPYIEYCIWNHILPSAEPGMISIVFRQENENLEIVVSDPGVEADKEAKLKLDEIKSLINKRIELSYEEDLLSFEPLVFTRDEGLNTLSIKLPLEIMKGGGGILKTEKMKS